MVWYNLSCKLTSYFSLLSDCLYFKQLLEQEESLPFFVTVLEKLAFISPIYILILVQVHGKFKILLLTI